MTGNSIKPVSETDMKKSCKGASISKAPHEYFIVISHKETLLKRQVLSVLSIVFLALDDKAGLSETAHNKVCVSKRNDIYWYSSIPGIGSSKFL